jgi:hypothetical protein
MISDTNKRYGAAFLRVPFVQEFHSILNPEPLSGIKAKALEDLFG